MRGIVPTILFAIKQYQALLSIETTARSENCRIPSESRPTLDNCAACRGYRAVDKEGATVGFLLRAKRDNAAAKAYLKKAMRQNGEPEKVTMDRSGANKVAMDEINQDREVPIEVRQVKYLNNIVEHDHCAVKRITKPMLGFKSFWAAKAVLAGI